MNKEEYKNEIKELIENDDELAYGSDKEVIYEIDGLKVYGGFYNGIRGVDHNILSNNEVKWKDILQWGTLVVPEFQTYIGDFPILKYEKMGYRRADLDNNHIMGSKKSQQFEQGLEL
ncbi:hypothetical protein LQF60_09045 [Tetragenococcus koreensis]|uniref:hypothetical protein n=1 Tax=Tetragenococcus TaxID=51668 RepID=UPI001F469587|nr:MULTISPECIES: hypothetical protein [Tetragenococcus]MDN6640984.1 hypothetical protein [Tetragenococcus sp.]MCF1585711.1 hypothetical protein [Tetragenococcus koreensis]MCF1615344.1 hypothetical protein [Tetragenococcus koreensis]MCF1625141.1 hypothetical protein [Tetragenococcus koreensis]MCF1629977.1 hypothetical protein [Tetragenococcus koreensis]